MLACPKCTSYMFPGRKKGVQIDCCSSCNGIWLDKGELATIAQTPQDIPGSQQVLQSNPTNFPCPRDGTKLNEHPYSTGENLLVDSCTKCSGVYLDKGELEKIEGLARQINEVFTPQWQSQSQSQAKMNEALSSVYKTERPAAKAPVDARTSFIEQVYLLLVATLVVTAGTAYWAIVSGLAMKFFVPALIAEIVVFIVCLVVRRQPGINMIALFSYTALSGFTLAAVLERYLQKGQGEIIWQAAALCALIFGILSTYVHITKKDFDWMGGILLVALIMLIVAGIGFMFFPSAFGMFMWSCISAVIFSGFILYDTSRVILKYDTQEVVSAVLDLYLDVINLFLDLLRILSYLRR